MGLEEHRLAFRGSLDRSVTCGCGLVRNSFPAAGFDVHIPPIARADEEIFRAPCAETSASASASGFGGGRKTRHARQIGHHTEMEVLLVMASRRAHRRCGSCGSRLCQGQVDLSC